MDDAEAVRNSTLRCASAQPDPGCKITQRYQYMVLRGVPKEIVFTQMVLGFEVASADPRFVGINLVQPEEWYVARRDFVLHMRMLQYLHSVYPKVHIALHAGELAQGMVPPEELSFHVRSSVEIGGAERIGHGMDVMYEDRPQELLRELAQRNVMIEICLTSNATILGVTGNRHPLGEYIRAGVPVALATDDEGVSRSDMTQEYLRAALDQGLSYTQLKTMARTSLEHAFISGDSLVERCQKLHAGEGVPVRFAHAANAVGDMPKLSQEERQGKPAMGAGIAIAHIRVAALAEYACARAVAVDLVRCPRSSLPIRALAQSGTARVPLSLTADNWQPATGCRQLTIMISRVKCGSCPA